MGLTTMLKKIKLLLASSGGRLVNQGDAYEAMLGSVSQVVMSGAGTYTPQVGSKFTSILVFGDTKISAAVPVSGYTITGIADLYGEAIPAGVVYPIRATSITTTEGLAIAYEGD